MIEDQGVMGVVAVKQEESMGNQSQKKNIIKYIYIFDYYGIPILYGYKFF